MAWPLYLGMEDIQSLPDVVREVLRRIADLQEEGRSLTPFITPSLGRPGPLPLLGPLLPVFQPEWATLKHRLSFGALAATLTPRSSGLR